MDEEKKESPLWGVLNAILNAGDSDAQRDKTKTALRRAPSVGNGAGGQGGFAGAGGSPPAAPTKTCCVAKRPKK